MSRDDQSSGKPTPAADQSLGALAPTLQEDGVPGPITSTEPVGVDEHELLDGRYELLAMIGYGGMGNVYKAYDRELDETVALKTLKHELSTNERSVARFRSEVKLARRVSHRNVVRTYDLGICDGLLYLTMEYVQGRDLAGVLARQGPLSAPKFVAIAKPVCAGLSAAHDCGIIHRDLKPSNVILSDDGRVVITDFGIARAVRDPVGFDTGADNSMLGTPAYMSPEQVRGKDDIDHRTDIYALGVVFWEMLTGSLPFAKNSPVSTALARLTEPTPDLREARPDLPTGLIGMIAKCLQREPDNRYASVGELLVDFEALSTMPGLRPGWPSRPQTGPESPPKTRSASSRLNSLHFSVVDVQKPEAKSLAVMPFRWRGEPDEEYLADGLTEEIIDELSMSAGLKVRPRGAVMSYKGSGKSPRDIGRELGVHLVVDGGVRRVGERLRVRVALVSVEEGFQIWAKRFDGAVGELFEISEEAARSVVEALMAGRLAEPQASALAASAVDRYMKARRLMHDTWFGDMSAAIELFDEALAQAPRDAHLLSGAAIARARAAFFGGPNEERHLQAASDYANRAIEAAPHRAEPHLALARVYFMRQDFGPALAELRAALTRSPSSASAHDLMGRILRETGPVRAAIHHMNEALELDPQLHTTRWDLAQAQALAGNWEQVDELLEMDVETEDHLNARESARTRTDLWRDQPRWLDADAERPISPVSPHIRLMSDHRRELLRIGQFSQAWRELIEEILAGTRRGSRLDVLIRQVRAENLGAVGEVDAALEAVEDAVDAGLLDWVWLEHCRNFDLLRQHPRFEACLARVRERIRHVARQARSA